MSRLLDGLRRWARFQAVLRGRRGPAVLTDVAGPRERVRRVTQDALLSIDLNAHSGAARARS